MARTSRAFCVTINNPPFPGDELPHVDGERYVSWQAERGEQGTRHLQIYIELDRSVRGSHLQRFWPGCHYEARRGTREQARDYTRKADSREDGPWERGVFDQGGQGRRNDLADAVHVLRTEGMAGVIAQHPTAFVKFGRGLRELARELEERPTDADFEPRYWQQEILSFVTNVDADDRTIFWVTDTRGNTGKSRLARHLVLEHGAVQLEGKIADMAYQYNKEPIVIFDITRAAAEHCAHLYSFAEKLKNGMLNSTKYESCLKVFSPPHVIFFANFSWDREKWSEDRVIEVDLNNPEYFDA